MYEREIQELQQVGIRLTQQRLFILAFLNQHVERHLSVEEIFTALKKEQPALVIATVYNTINLFKERGLICPLEYPGEIVRFDRCVQEHLHFKCRNCGKIIDLPLGEKAQWQPAGFVVETCHVLLKGLCPGCASP